MSDMDTRDIALELSSTYDASEIDDLNIIEEAKRWRVTLDIMRDAIKMSKSFLSEDYW